MRHVALAVHGVSNRDESAFTQMVAELHSLGGETMPELRPVFWGDLGPEAPLLAIPGEQDVETVPEPARAFGAEPPPSAAEAARATADAAVAQLEREEGQVPASTANALREATQDAAAAGFTLALRVELAPLLVDVVRAAPPQGNAEIQPAGAFGVDWVKDRVVNLLAHAQDALVNILVREFRDREAGLASTIAHTIGDVLAYQSRGPAIRGRIDHAYRKAIGEGYEVDLVAHSLGALASVEWLLGASAGDASGSSSEPEDRQVRHLVTFGDQVSLFSELEGLRGLGDVVRSSTSPQVLPIRVGRWSNVWQELDPLAFVITHVLRTEIGEVPGIVEDLRLTQRGIPTNVSFHSSYWRDPRFARWLAGFLGGD